MIPKQGIFNIPFYNVKVLVLVPMPMLRGDEIILVNRYVFELGRIVGSLNLHDAATLRWLCPTSRSPAVPLLKGLIAGSGGASIAKRYKPQYYGQKVERKHKGNRDSESYKKRRPEERKRPRGFVQMRETSPAYLCYRLFQIRS
jgi:hypothetical protein